MPIAHFTVALTRASDKQVTVHWRTRDGSARAGIHYETGRGTLLFRPGELSKTVAVRVFPRGITNELIFMLSLHSPDGAALDKHFGICAIRPGAELPEIDFTDEVVRNLTDPGGTGRVKFAPDSLQRVLAYRIVGADAENTEGRQAYGYVKDWFETFTYFQPIHGAVNGVQQVVWDASVGVIKRWDHLFLIDFDFAAAGDQTWFLIKFKTDEGIFYRLAYVNRQGLGNHLTLYDEAGLDPDRSIQPTTGTDYGAVSIDGMRRFYTGVVEVTLFRGTVL